MECAHTIDLIGGYTDAKRVTHRRVTFGHRITGKDIFNLDSDPASQNPTQYQDLIVRAAITEFGTLTMPVPLQVLLNLDSIDREDLTEAHNKFQTLSLGERKAELLPEYQCKLAFGFTQLSQQLSPTSNVQSPKSGSGGQSLDLGRGTLDNEIRYDLVTFGHRVTGMDEVRADQIGLRPGVMRMCYLIGRQISRIERSELGGQRSEIEGPIDLAMFETLDCADIFTLRNAAESWRQSFRLNRTVVSQNGHSPHGAAARDEDRLAGVGAVVNAERAAEHVH